MSRPFYAKTHIEKGNRLPLQGFGRLAISRPLSTRSGAGEAVVVGVLFQMSKQKTKRAAAKRFKFTGTGKVKRAAAYHRHNLTHKPRAKKAQDRGGAILSAGDAKLVRMMLPHG